MFNRIEDVGCRAGNGWSCICLLRLQHFCVFLVLFYILYAVIYIVLYCASFASKLCLFPPQRLKVSQDERAFQKQDKGSLISKKKVHQAFMPLGWNLWSGRSFSLLQEHWSGLQDSQGIFVRSSLIFAHCIFVRMLILTLRTKWLVFKNSISESLSGLIIGSLLLFVQIFSCIDYALLSWIHRVNIFLI